MFNARTNVVVRLDIYERPNETYPANRVTYIDPDETPEEDACDEIDNPDTAPPAGYGAFHILIGFAYVKPPPVGSPLGTLGTPTVFNSFTGHVNFQLVLGSYNAAPAILPVAVHSGWVPFPLVPPPPPP
jgi:hypothetical protein